MAIHYKFDVEKDLLKVTATGQDDSIEDVKAYGLAIMKSAMETNCRKILCNESDLHYQLDTFDNFESAKFISENAPGVAKVAIVCNPRFIADAAFWETVAVNRGLQVKFFKTLHDAKEWLI